MQSKVGVYTDHQSTSPSLLQALEAEFQKALQALSDEFDTEKAEIQSSHNKQKKVRFWLYFSDHPSQLGVGAQNDHSFFSSLSKLRSHFVLSLQRRQAL